MDIPNRLPQPEKRKDKINKNDMRYLYKMQKTKSKQAKRQKLDEEINNEKRVSEKRARVSANSKVLKRTQPKTGDVKFTVTAAQEKSKKKWSPEVQLLGTGGGARALPPSL